MKRLFTLLSGICFLGFLTAGCEKDSEDPIRTDDNYQRIGNSEFGLGAGMLENYGRRSENSFEVDLTLVSPNIVIPQVASDPVTGSGQAIVFYMLSSSPTVLTNGTYGYLQDASYPHSKFFYGEYTLNFDSESDTPPLWTEITSGDITVSRSGENYDITFRCKDINDQDITGHYQGPLSYFNYSIVVNTRQMLNKFSRHNEVLTKAGLPLLPLP